LKLLALEQSLPKGPVIVELPFDRLIDLCLIEESAFLKGRLFACVRYFLKLGEESLFTSEFEQLTRALKTFKNMQMSIHLSLDDPCPSLREVFDFMRSHKRLARCLILSRQRSTRKLIQTLMADDSKENTELPSVDVMSVYKRMEEDSDSLVRASGERLDFKYFR
jgi:hypothetical protein